MASRANEKPLIFIVAPPLPGRTKVPAGVSIAADEARKSLQRSAENLGWTVVTRRSVSYRARDGDNGGRPFEVLEPWDAHDLYRFLHRRPTAVVQIGDPVVCMNPQDAPSDKNTWTLERFTRYKSYFARLGRSRTEAELSAILRSFVEWIADCSCEGERDSRILPLHAFSPTRDWALLNDQKGAAAFEDVHGGPTSRADDLGRAWKAASDLHGQDELVISGTRLRAGFHWDVKTDHREGRLFTSAEVWKFTSNSYCNVYPDASVRQGQRSGLRAKRVFAAQRPAELGQSGRPKGRGGGRERTQKGRR